jgi:hypothetical protein
MAEWQPPNLTAKGLGALNTHRTRQIRAHVTFGSLSSWRKAQGSPVTRGSVSSASHYRSLGWAHFRRRPSSIPEMKCRSWVAENKGDYFTKWLISIWKCWQASKIRGWTHNFLAPLSQHKNASHLMRVNSDSVLNEINESESQCEKHDEQSIWT